MKFLGVFTRTQRDINNLIDIIIQSDVSTNHPSDSLHLNRSTNRSFEGDRPTSACRLRHHESNVFCPSQVLPLRRSYPPFYSCSRPTTGLVGCTAREASRRGGRRQVGRPTYNMSTTMKNCCRVRHSTRHGVETHPYYWGHHVYVCTAKYCECCFAVFKTTA